MYAVFFPFKVGNLLLKMYISLYGKICFCYGILKKFNYLYHYSYYYCSISSRGEFSAFGCSLGNFEIIYFYITHMRVHKYQNICAHSLVWRFNPEALNCPYYSWPLKLNPTTVAGWLLLSTQCSIFPNGASIISMTHKGAFQALIISVHMETHALKLV